jgi:hypothetical protein
MNVQAQVVFVHFVTSVVSVSGEWVEDIDGVEIELNAGYLYVGC